MQIKQYLKGIAASVLAPVMKSLDATYPYYGAGIRLLSGGGFAYSTSGMQAYSNKIFYAGQNILVRKFTEAPILFSKKKESAQKFDKYYSKAISNESRAALKARALDELTSHKLINLFENPNTYQSGIETMVDFWHNYGFGDGYLFFEPLNPEISRDTRPVRLHSLNRNRVTPIRSTDRFDTIIGYRYTCWNGDWIEIPKSNMLHLMHWNPNLGDLRGLGVDVIAGMDIGINQANSIAKGAAFTNGGRGTLFSSDADLNTEGVMIGKWTKDQKDSLQKTIDMDMAGASNNGKLLMTNGYVQVQPYGDTMAELELNLAQDQDWQNIFAVMGIPWALTPVASKSSENSIIAGYKALVTNLIISELKKFDQKLTQKIQQWYPGVIACHDLTEFSELAPDLKLMSEVYNRNTGPVLSENERRAIFGYDAIKGAVGKAYLVPSGLMKVEDIVNDPLSDIPNPADDNAITEL